MSFLLRDARLILDPSRGIVPGWLLIEKGRISRMGGEGDIPPGGMPVMDCGGDYLAAGLIDLHAHGALGRDTMEASEEAFGTILAEHARRGTTTLVLTTVAASPEDVLRVLRMAETWNVAPGMARLAGIHLEGPWFSTKRCGAHDAVQLRHPDPLEVAALLKHREVIRRVTLAPELPGAREAVRRLISEGVSVSAGHSDATEEEAREGFSAGITQVTHLHNAMSSRRKTDPPRRGLAEAALETSGILCELIADGVHVPGELLREAFLAKGWKGIALVSDATAGAGLGEGESFRLGSLECRVEEGAARISDHRLAGSTRFLLDGVRTMTEQAGVPLAEAVAMATITPSRALGLERETGSLEIGKRADLLRFSQDWKLRKVWIGGESLFHSPS